VGVLQGEAAIAARAMSLPISLEEAKRAIYLDFEGSMGWPPTLCGLAYTDREQADGEAPIRQVILERTFDSCSRRRGARHVVAMEPQGFLAYLLDLVTKEHRLLVSWSEHDLKKLMGMCEGIGALHESVQLQQAHRNARKLAVRWLWKTRTTRFGRGNNQLVRYLPLFGLAVPERFGTDIVGVALRDLRSRLSRPGGSYATLSSRRHELWRQVVRHNQFDCNYMRQMVLRMIAEQATQPL
jgi:hypothetical protein